MKNKLIQSDYFVIVIVIGLIILFGVYVKSRTPLEEVKPYSKREIDSLAKIVSDRDSISAISVEKQTRIAMRAEEKENKKFYATKAGRIYKKHPEWPREACVRLANKEVWIGMSLDMLKYLRGLPDAANESNYGKGPQWQWCWYEESPSCFYDKDDDGHIDAYN